MRKKAGEINIAPLVDVLLVLLVIFMVTTPMMVREIYVDVPQVVSLVRSKNVINNDRILTVSIDENQKLFFNGKPMTLEGLIIALKKESPDSVVALEGSKKLGYQVIYSLLTRLQDAGFYNIALTGFF